MDVSVRHNDVAEKDVSLVLKGLLHYMIPSITHLYYNPCEKFLTIQRLISVALRKLVRRTDVIARLKDCVVYNYKHDISKFMTYEKCNQSLKWFITLLYSISIPKVLKIPWRILNGKLIFKRKLLNAFEKNNTYELVEFQHIMNQWDVSGYMLLDTILKQYKARLVAKGYTQTYTRHIISKLFFPWQRWTLHEL
jgi:hypothetical protein